jgi:hypothetical protein
MSKIVSKVIQKKVGLTSLYFLLKFEVLAIFCKLIN